jgi:xylitol oxidase
VITVGGVSLTNWSGNVTFSTETLHRPRTVEQLQELVAASPRLRVLGSGHSFNRIADTPGDLVSVADLDVKIELDEAAHTVAVGGGVRYGELAAYLQARGWALHNLGSLPHITVAGACATGTHGSGDGNGCLATAAVAVEFVRADGELVRLTRADDTFAGAVLALGALGVVVRLWLTVQPTFDLRQDVWVDARLDDVVENLDDVMAAGYSVSLFTDWGGAETLDQIWIKARAEAEPVDGRRWGATQAARPYHPIKAVDGATATDQTGTAGPWNTRLPHFRLEFTPSSGDEQQSEFFVARENGAAAIEALRGLDLSPTIMVSEVRSIAADSLWLSPFHGRDALALHFTWVSDDVAVRKAVQQVESALHDLDARPHWAKVFTTDRAGQEHHYPQLARFRALIDEYDPEHRFGNEFLETFVY